MYSITKNIVLLGHLARTYSQFSLVPDTLADQY